MLPRRARLPLVWLLFVALGCGARTTLTEEEFESFGGSGGSKNVSSGGVSSGSAGSGGISSGGGVSTGGVPGSGGVTTGGSAGGAGVGGAAGVEGTAGVGGVGGGVGVGQLKEACDALCASYVVACPSEFANASECVSSCLEDGRQTPRPCRPALADALYCLGSALDPSLTCDEAAAQAIFVCANQVDAYETCSDSIGPTPSPVCSSVASIGEFDCSLSLYCPDASFLVSCTFETPSLSDCTCSDYSSTVAFKVNASLVTACDEAVGYCG